MSDREYVDFKKLKQRVSMRDLLDHYDLTNKMERKSENTLVGPCPITGSSSQAFKVNTEKDVWYSFALEEDGAGGNVLDFVARMEDTDILGAANLIDEWFDIEDDSESRPDEASDSSEEAEESSSNQPGENAHTDTADALLRMCGEEVVALEEEAREEIEELLGELEPSDKGMLDEVKREAASDWLHRWIVRAYRRGYRLGKMQGRIDERVSQLG